MTEFEKNEFQEEESNNKTGTLLLTVIGVATLLVAVIGATFAFFTANFTGVETDTTVTLGAGRLDIHFANGTANLESATGIVPQVPNETWPHGAPVIIKEFTITGNNTTETVMPYGLNLVVSLNTFSNGALTYSLTSSADAQPGTPVPAITTPLGINSVSTTDEDLVIALGTGNFAGVVTNSVHSYVLRVFFRDTLENQDVDQNRSFAAHVQTTVQAAHTTTTVAP